VQPAFNHRLLELTSLSGDRLADPHGLSAMVVAAAGAVGMPTLGPPVVRDGPGGIVIAMLCREGHIVLHTAPAEGLCVVDIVARAPADVRKGVEVIARRLGVPTEPA
jgi:S-adenosylmethionine/arginine decarboxylase-like enzyme